MMRPLSAEEVRRQLDVSRETIQRLEAYVAVLVKWQRSINLVSQSTIDDIWRRHILDSGQVFRLLRDPSAPVMDIGSGAGLPGLVLAILGAEEAATPLTLVESDERKCAFLGIAAREAGVKIRIINDRIEASPAQQPAVITARALAPLEKLLDWTRAQHHPGLECLFLKGARHQEELTSLVNYPNIRSEIIPSQTSPDGVILRLSGF